MFLLPLLGLSALLLFTINIFCIEISPLAPACLYPSSNRGSDTHESSASVLPSASGCWTWRETLHTW